jgi:hypothetical protein
LLESSVFLCEKASVDLEFFQRGLGVGHYVCSGVDCVLAGNTFNLTRGAALSLGFEIPRLDARVRSRSRSLARRCLRSASNKCAS